MPRISWSSLWGDITHRSLNFDTSWLSKCHFIRAVTSYIAGNRRNWKKLAPEMPSTCWTSYTSSARDHTSSMAPILVAPPIALFPFSLIVNLHRAGSSSNYICLYWHSIFTLFRFPNLYWEYLKVLGSESHGSPARCSLRRRLILTLRPLAASAGKFTKLYLSSFHFWWPSIGCYIHLMHACVTADVDLLGPMIFACLCFVFLNPILTNPDLFLLPAGSSYSPLRSSRTSDVALQMASLSSSSSSGWLAMCSTY